MLARPNSCSRTPWPSEGSIQGPIRSFHYGNGQTLYGWVWSKKVILRQTHGAVHE